MKIYELRIGFYGTYPDKVFYRIAESEEEALKDEEYHIWTNYGWEGKGAKEVSGDDIIMYYLKTFSDKYSLEYKIIKKR